MAKIEELKHLPEINFVETDVETMLSDAIRTYEEAFYDQTGKKKTLSPGDPVRIWIYSQVLKLYHAHMLIDKTAKKNLLYYAEDEPLDHLGARVGEEREEAKAAIVTVRINLSASQSNPVPIEEGTRASAANNIFFETTEYHEIPTGESSYEVEMTCTETGTIGNDFTPGQIDTLVDPIPYAESVENIDTSQGGAEKENNESLTRKIYLKPESFSTAGPELAYDFFTREYNQSIIDVSVDSPSAGVVDVRFLLEDGEIPDAAIIDGVKDYLSDKKRRPLTDNVTVQAPDQVSYDIDITYYISDDEEEFAQSIQNEVNKAVDEYILWQKIKIGRDINPSELIYKIRRAGAKRVEVTAPVFTTISNIEVASEGTININYGGLEDE